MQVIGESDIIHFADQMKLLPWFYEYDCKHYDYSGTMNNKTFSPLKDTIYYALFGGYFTKLQKNECILLLFENHEKDTVIIAKFHKKCDDSQTFHFITCYPTLKNPEFNIEIWAMATIMLHIIILVIGCAFGIPQSFLLYFVLFLLSVFFSVIASLIFKSTTKNIKFHKSKAASLFLASVMQ